MDRDELIKRLEELEGDGRTFLENLLAVQCDFCGGEGAAVLRLAEGKGVDVLALYPQQQEKPQPASWLIQGAQTAADALGGNKIAVRRLTEADGALTREKNAYVVAIPAILVSAGAVALLVVFRAANEHEAMSHGQRLDIVARLVRYCESRPGGGHGMRRLQSAIETLAATNRFNRFGSAAMSFCNEIASQWHCQRVSTGFLKGRYVQLRAMSHTEHFNRKMEIVGNLEAVMEESLDQDIEVAFPGTEDNPCIVRAAAHFSSRHGPVALLSLPLRFTGNVVGVVTLERSPDNPFRLEEIETLRLACEMCTPRLVELWEHDRWIGGRIAKRAERFFAAFLGPEHTWAKITAAAVCAAIVFLVFASGQYRPKAPFILEAVYQQVIPAPFDGYIKTVNAEVGDEVEAGESVLAALDTAELRLQLAAGKAEQSGYLKQAAAAMRDGQTAQAQIAQANADKLAAQIDLILYRIEQAAIISPITGIVVSGDLKRETGKPVKTGEILFEVTPIDWLRAELLVSEEDIFEIRAGQEGRLATASYPAEPIPFVVERVNPMAEIVKQRNVFRVRVRLEETRPWMRPGMEGVAKVSVGKRHYAWIWTRKMINWIRMKLWL
ncbi:MAG: HlyD family efflux transporter periplasmic adaptor subunit [Phycisphaerae bacterium]|nr:HlyD family efflux transporter periplasmic adaptor subunit [Phycisphaerae bacterium]